MSVTVEHGVEPVPENYVAKWSVDRVDEPRNVVAALARVLAEIGGIGKMTSQERAKAGMGGGDTGIAYAYRGIDQIAGAAQPLLGRYGVVIVPTILESRVDSITVNQRPWTDTWVRVRWDIYGPGGLSDRIEAITEGLGRDNADKGQNKAITSAAKNLLLRLLMIGDSTDDSDGHTYERDKDEAPSRPQPLTENWMKVWRGNMIDDGLDPDKVLWEAFGNMVPNPLMPEHIQPMRDAYLRLKVPDDAPELRHDDNQGVPGVPTLPLNSANEQPTPAPDDDVDLANPPNEPRPVSSDQVGRIKAEYKRLGIPRDGQLELTGLLLGHDVVSHNQLTFDESARVLAELKNRKPAGSP